MRIVMLCDACVDPAVCVAHFRTAVKAAGLDMTQDGGLATLPGSTHIHLRHRGERSGTLEYTMDARGRRAWLSWLSWRENRHRPWIEGAVALLANVGCGDSAPRRGS